MVSTYKTIKFPHRRSLGTLFCAPYDQPEEWQLLSEVRGLIVAPENQPIKWEWLEEARGNVKVPSDAKLKLKISARGASLGALADLAADDLHALDFSYSPVTDASLSHLCHLSGLKVLELTSTSIGDNGVAFVSQLTNLQSLGLSHSRVTTEGLCHLKKLKKLREIWLSGTDVDDCGLASFEELHLLVQLGLTGTKITDNGLNHLLNLHNLLRVYLFNTRVSHNGTQMLKRQLPGCRVKWHPTKIHTQDAEETEFTKTTNGKGYGSIDPLPPVALDLGAISSCADGFWEIIGLLDWDKAGDDAAVVEPAVAALAQRPVAEICRFAEILAEKLYMLDGEPYASQIGSDAYNGVKGEFSKNWFLYVRCCVVANGKEFYEAALADPKEMPQDMEFQALLTIPSKAFKRKTGQRFSYVTKYNYETFSNKQLWGGA
jgi:hypothetical protein